MPQSATDCGFFISIAVNLALFHSIYAAIHFPSVAALPLFLPALLHR